LAADSEPSLRPPPRRRSRLASEHVLEWCGFYVHEVRHARDLPLAKRTAGA